MHRTSNAGMPAMKPSNPATRCSCYSMHGTTDNYIGLMLLDPRLAANVSTGKRHTVCSVICQAYLRL